MSDETELLNFTANDADLAGVLDELIGLMANLETQVGQATASFDTLTAASDGMDVSFASLGDAAAFADEQLALLAGTSDELQVAFAGIGEASAYADAQLALFNASTVESAAATAEATVSTQANAVATQEGATADEQAALAKATSAQAARDKAAADKAAALADREAAASAAAHREALGTLQGAFSGLIDKLKMLVMVSGFVEAVIGVVSAKMAGDFQQNITKLYTTAGELHKNLQMVGDGILKMSTDVGTGALQLSQSMYWIESGGLHGARALDAERVAAEAAKAENADLDKVSIALAASLNAYAGSGMSTVQVMNTLTAATGQGMMTFEQLSGSLASVLPAAAKFHVSLTDVTAALADMTAQGDPAANAATHLRQILLALEAPTKNGAAALKEVGLTSTEVANEMKVSLPGALQMITDAVGKKFPQGSEAYKAALRDIAGGSKQFLGFLELTGSHMGAFVDNVKKISSAVHQGGNDLMGWSDIQQNFNFKLDQAKAMVEALFIKIGTALLPVLSNLLGTITPIISRFGTWLLEGNRLQNSINSVVGAINHMIAVGASVIAFFQHNQTAMTALEVTLGVVAGLIAGAMVAAFLAWAAAAWTAAAGVIAATWPILLIAAAIGGLAVGFMLLYNSSAGFRSAIAAIGASFVSLWHGIQQVWAVISSVLMPVLQQLNSFIISNFTPVWQQLVSMWQSQLMPLFKQLWAAIQPLIPVLEVLGAVILGVVVVAIGMLVATLFGVIKGIAGFLSGLMIVIQGIVQVFTGLIQVISGIVRVIIDIFTGNFGDLGAAFGQIWQGIINIFAGAWTIIAGIFLTAWFTISGIVSGFVSGLLAFFAPVGNAIANALRGPINSVIGWIGGAWNTVKNITVSVFNAVISWLVGAWQHAIGWLGGAWNSIAGLATSVWNAVKSAIVSVVNGIVTWLTTAWHNAVNAVVGAFQWLYDHNYYWKAMVDTIRNVVSSVVSWLVTAWHNTTTFIVNAWNWLKTQATNVWNTVKNAIMSVVNTVISWLTNIWNTEVRGLTIIWNKLSGLATSAWNAVKNTVMSVVNSVISWLQGQWNTAIGWLGDKWNTLSNLAQTAWNAVVGVFNSVWGPISGALSSLWGNIAGWFNGLVGKMLAFGRMLIQGLIDGINSMLGAVGNAVGNVASKIVGVLGFHKSVFTPPKEGPAKNADRWAPDLMKGFAEGIIAGQGEIERATNLMASNLMPKTALSLPSFSVGSNGGNDTLQQLLQEQRKTNMLLQAMQHLAMSNGGNINIGNINGVQNLSDLQRQLNSIGGTLVEYGGRNGSTVY